MSGLDAENAFTAENMGKRPKMLEHIVEEELPTEEPAKELEETEDMKVNKDAVKSTVPKRKRSK